MTRWMLGAAVAVLTACSQGGTGPAADYTTVLAVQQTKWTGARPTNYAFDYKVTGFFTLYTDRTLRVTVRADTVASAVVNDGGAPLVLPLRTFPTLDQLFARLMTNAHEGTLTAVEFDPTYGFPAAYAVSGAADSGGAGFVTAFASVP